MIACLYSVLVSPDVSWRLPLSPVVSHAWERRKRWGRRRARSAASGVGENGVCCVLTPAFCAGFLRSAGFDNSGVSSRASARLDSRGERKPLSSRSFVDRLADKLKTNWAQICRQIAGRAQAECRQNADKSASRCADRCAGEDEVEHANEGRRKAASVDVAWVPRGRMFYRLRYLS